MDVVETTEVDALNTDRPSDSNKTSDTSKQSKTASFSLFQYRSVMMMSMDSLISCADKSNEEVERGGVAIAVVIAKVVAEVKVVVAVGVVAMIAPVHFAECATTADEL